MTDSPGKPVKEYQPRRPWRRGRILLDRRKPFELFLRFRGPIYDVHFQIHRLVICYETKTLRKPKRDAR